MSLKIGIVGLPNIGKSTLFNALTQKKVDISNYPFCTIEPNVGIVSVPDERLAKLAKLSQSKKIIPAVVEFVDIAGLVKGAAEGEGLGNKFLTHIKGVDLIAEVVRIFEDENIIHVAGAPNPVSDIEIIEYELALKDLEAVEKYLATLEKQVRAGKKEALEAQGVLKKIRAALKEGKPARSILTPEEKHIIKNLELLTVKDVIYVFNASESQIQKNWKPDEAVMKKLGNARYAVVSAKVEQELSELKDEEKREYLSSFSIKEGGLDQLIRLGYSCLGLITFFTTGEDETRAWTIPLGSRAPCAGRAIHSDFEEKFIRAEVISWEKLMESGSWTKAREQGTLRTEGKDYIVKDGDVIEFKI